MKCYLFQLQQLVANFLHQQQTLSLVQFSFSLMQRPVAPYSTVLLVVHYPFYLKIKLLGWIFENEHVLVDKKYEFTKNNY